MPRRTGEQGVVMASSPGVHLSGQPPKMPGAKVRTRPPGVGGVGRKSVVADAGPESPPSSDFSRTKTNPDAYLNSTDSRTKVQTDAHLNSKASGSAGASRSGPGLETTTSEEPGPTRSQLSVAESQEEFSRLPDGVAPGTPAPSRVDGGRYAYESLLALCRVDVDAFNEFVLRDEETNQPVEQASMHVEMQRALDEDRYVVILAHPESGKTQQMAVGRTLHLLGQDPGHRVAFLNNTQDGGSKSLRAVKKYVTESAELRAVFPRLRAGGMWREDAITVERPDSMAKDPSVQCVGFHGNVLGARIDYAAVDDLLDFENTRTESARLDCASWFKRSFLTRLSDRAKVAFLTNAWHEEDLAHDLSDSGWKLLKYPVLDSAGLSTWPSRWSLSRIAERRKLVGPLEFARMYLCQPRDPGAEVFGPELLRLALFRGRGYGLCTELPGNLPGCLVVTGVDLGSSKKLTGGETSMSTVLFHPGGTRQLVGLRAGRWSGRGILRNLSEVSDAFGGYVVVENNATQQHLVDLAQEDGDHYEISAPVVPFQTGRNKHDAVLGVDAMAAEFESRRWLLPSGRDGKARDSEQVRKLLNELRAYSPSSHPGDRLMSLWMARTWGSERIRRMRRRAQNPEGAVRATVLG